MTCVSDPAWSKRQSLTIKPSPEEILPIFGELFSRSTIKQWIKESSSRLYWRVLTPLVILWGLIYQRLTSDGSCDAIVSYLHTGAFDRLDREDTNKQPLSKRLNSRSTSAYVQGRNRLPFEVLSKALTLVRTTIIGWLQSAPNSLSSHSLGHAVRLLDGTTFRMRPTEELLLTYKQASNGKGKSYWVVVKSLMCCCPFSQTVVGWAEGGISEPAMISAVMKQDPSPDSIYVGDSGLGVYRVAQVAAFLGKKVLLRLEQRTARILAKSAKVKGGMSSGYDCIVTWKTQPSTKVEPDLLASPLIGRLIYVQLQKKGFRPIDLYLFTDLIDSDKYKNSELVDLYGLRWQCEVDYLHIKSTLKMSDFDVKTPEMFRKELAAGLLTYNLICALIVKAAIVAGVAPNKLSFSSCTRRLRDALHSGVPLWVYESKQLLDWLLSQMAKCLLPHQPNKVLYEPRKVRSRPQPFPILKGDREAARKQVLEEMASKN